MQEDTLVSEINYPIKSSVTSITRTTYIVMRLISLRSLAISYLFAATKNVGLHYIKYATLAK